MIKHIYFEERSSAERQNGFGAYFACSDVSTRPLLCINFGDLDSNSGEKKEK